MSKVNSFLQKARAKLYDFPETPVGWKLKQQLWSEDVAVHLEELIAEEIRNINKVKIRHMDKVNKEGAEKLSGSHLVNELDHAKSLLEEKIKPALYEVLKSTTKAKDPRIILQRGDGNLRDKLIEMASPTQYAITAASMLVNLVIYKSPVKALKRLAYDLSFHAMMSKVRPFSAQYDSLTNTIPCKAYPEDEFLLLMAHEYVHFLQHHHSFNTPRIRYSKFLLEGHAEASALAAMRFLEEEGKLGPAAFDLHWTSVNHLASTYKIVCEKIGKEPRRDCLVWSSSSGTANVYDTGATLFRLAEEKNGKDVCARMLLGDIAALKI